VRVTAAAASDIGRVRDGNEDSFLNEAPLFAVADGMGGHRGGDVASRLALETLEVVNKHGRGTLVEQVLDANRAVFERSSRDPAVAGMGTTLTAAVAEAGRLRLAHVGDSRAYLLRGAELRMLTEDHTLVHRMVASGEISPQEAEVHPHRSVLTRALGTAPDVQVDEVVIDAEDGDRILLCTDGLTGMVGDDEIRAVLRDEREPRDAVKRLVRAANAGGGVDNITVVILDISLDADDRGAASAHGAAGGTGTIHDGARSGRSGAARAAARRRRVPRIALWAVAAALVLLVAGLGLRFYLDQQWYVGEAGGRVAVFRGIPSEVLGFRLHRAVVLTPLRAADVAQLEFYGDLAGGITAEDRAAADDIVAQMSADLRAKQAAEERARRQAERQRQRERRREQRQKKKQERNAA
jgi:serine/threonine protein phosphatase PrpC